MAKINMATIIDERRDSFHAAQKFKIFSSSFLFASLEERRSLMELFQRVAVRSPMSIFSSSFLLLSLFRSFFPSEIQIKSIIHFFFFTAENFLHLTNQKFINKKIDDHSLNFLLIEKIQPFFSQNPFRE